MEIAVAFATNDIMELQRKRVIDRNMPSYRQLKETNKRKIILYSLVAIFIFLAGIKLMQYVLPIAQEFKNITNEVVNNFEYARF